MIHIIQRFQVRTGKEGLFAQRWAGRVKQLRENRNLVDTRLLRDWSYPTRFVSVISVEKADKDLAVEEAPDKWVDAVAGVAGLLTVEVYEEVDDTQLGAEEQKLDEALEESFPASDPPSTMEG